MQSTGSVISKTNWSTFNVIFNSLRAVEKVMGNLNTLRGLIAHCSFLAEDEGLRLQLSVRDWSTAQLHVKYLCH